MDIPRRSFIKTGLAATVGIALSPHITVKSQQVYKNSDFNISLFSKSIQFLDYDRMADVVTKLGFDGVDLTVRSNGHIQPENVETELPKAAKAMERAGKKITMIATDIVDADRNAGIILSTASSLGIKYYRTGYFRYDDNRDINSVLDESRRKIERMEKMNRKYNIHGCYQNHSGPYKFIGGAVWDLHRIIRDFDPEFIGIQYDIMHASVEGAYAWPYALRLVAPWIKVLALKDYIWEQDGTGKWKDKVTPLGEGMVDFDAYLNEIKRLKIPANFTMHNMYDLGGAETGSLTPNMNEDTIFRKIKKDMDFMYRILSR
ncbi:MAG: sugar phosphate isomerase/epimerase [Proteiniphilum sp.]|jgi:sugar phosphate isomerase/epimerase|nr:sugar phosphate isomerase/epimerase [Proteiniphilum sp.]